jgi:multiple sugar transport system ATP-binding protein
LVGKIARPRLFHEKIGGAFSGIIVAKVALENIYKTYTAGSGATPVLKRINLSIEDGEFMVLVGPSGCGKSTLLRLVAGLEQLTGGNIKIGDRLVNDLPSKERDIAMVFQSYALYPHMRVYDNIAFGLRRRAPADPKAPAPNVLANFLVEATRNLPPKLRYETSRERDIRQQVKTVAEMLQIEGLLNRLPKQLSGGQKQRVALGRAIARNAQVFLMDEPLSNLDAKLRAETRSQIVQLQRQLNKTTIYVTHDQTEAMTMGDRIAVMYQGQIQQVAAPLEIYNQPVNTFVAQFIGSPPMNFIPVKVDQSVINNYDFRLALDQRWDKAIHNYDRGSLLLGIRPEHLTLSTPAPEHLHGGVAMVEALGTDTFIMVQLQDLAEPDLTIQVRVPADQIVSIGQEVWLALTPDKIHLFDPQTTLALIPT